MIYRIYKMHFKTGLRVGTGSIESNSIEMPSDFLFSAVINEASKISEEYCEALLKMFFEKKIKLSDAFPFIGEEYLLPKPIKSIKGSSGDSNEKKLYKKISHIPLKYFNEFINGSSDPKEILLISDRLGFTQTDTKIKYSKTSENEIYSLSYYRFNKDNGLYFICGFETENEEEIFDDIFYGLSFTGIGGKKSSGLGKFEVEVDNLPKELINRIDSPNSNMLLTTSMATEEELNNISNNGTYFLIRRGGFIYTECPLTKDTITTRKKTMYFFKSGSIFKERFEGKIFRVDKDFPHPVYRYSIPIWMEV